MTLRTDHRLAATLTAAMLCCRVSPEPPPPLGSSPPVAAAKSASTPQILAITRGSGDDFPVALEIVPQRDRASNALLVRLDLPGAPIEYGQVALELFKNSVDQPNVLGRDDFFYRPGDLSRFSVHHIWAMHVPPGSYRVRATATLHRIHQVSPEETRWEAVERIQNATFRCSAPGDLAEKEAPAEPVCELQHRCVLDLYGNNKDKQDDPEAIRTFEQCLRQIPPGLVTKVLVEGHADDVGSDEHNCDLGRRRAEKVVARLKERFSALIPELDTCGACLPVPGTSSGSSDPKNRRVEVTLAFPDAPRELDHETCAACCR